MPSKTTKVIKSVKTSAKTAAAKVKPVAKKVAAKTKAAGQSAVKKTAIKAKAGKKKATGFVQSVKDGVHTGIEAVTDLVKKVTPDALLPKSAKKGRK